MIALLQLTLLMLVVYVVEDSFGRNPNRYAADTAIMHSLMAGLITWSVSGGIGYCLLLLVTTLIFKDASVRTQKIVNFILPIPFLIGLYCFKH